ncbi:hypothetical protein F5Y10DRAFT_196121 [Nemania abortiva]|nr:hypothetical protein F5Y10DRAFT_196121 [Nemania abortiva]
MIFYFQAFRQWWYGSPLHRFGNRCTCTVAIVTVVLIIDRPTRKLPNFDHKSALALYLTSVVFSCAARVWGNIVMEGTLYHLISPVALKYTPITIATPYHPISLFSFKVQGADVHAATICMQNLGRAGCVAPVKGRHGGAVYLSDNGRDDLPSWMGGKSKGNGVSRRHNTTPP